ncbi:UTP-glucose-1-phosphate uridylyltransferase [Blattabacterium sp. (Blattella germanica) str. Bge]|uniref:sugar phosphate nucleotidyltransferase n=1 Tax=Blattabacterium sp. (Blattella germanica) TaxID=624186 RepID=UPI0001BB629E|nr:sugar phosphate nucleotidyltransferase [Blattabacterium sp. (Blattella germanica)]ACY40605.1 UTP-glucose-1-phosphate uridylyltransferase [Blattabacterium sp. (Blattella germanica) str. Bge]
MKIIIPMAGKGLRLYPHTLSTPKAFIHIAGKTILRRLVESFSEVIKIFSVQEIIFIIGNNVGNIETKLIKLANDIGVHPIIYYQITPLGTADALLRAKDSLNGEPVIIAFSDTLFDNTSLEKEITNQVDNIIWTKKVQNPHLFGVVKCDSSGIVTHFIEKPNNYVSNLAIIGLYYFKNSLFLRKELESQSISYNNNQEYQLTSVLENMRKKGERFTYKQVKGWMDFGDQKRTISSNSKILSIESNHSQLIHEKSIIKNSFIIKPCSIGKNTKIENSIIGPYVSIGKNTKIKNSNIIRSLIQDDTKIQYANLQNSMIGNHTCYIGETKEVNLGDYSAYN